MTTMQISGEFQAVSSVSSSAETDKSGTWCGSIPTADGKDACVIYTGFARSAADVMSATRSAARNALVTIAFAANSSPVALGQFEGVAVTANRSTNPPVDVFAISEIGQTRWWFSLSFGWEKHPIGHSHIFWPHELVVTGEPYFPQQPWGTGMPNAPGGRRAISEAAAARLMESVLWTDPAIRRALASGRKLSVKWGSGFFPGWAINKTALCVARFAVWDVDDNALVEVGNTAAQAVLNVALRTRNLGARREGILSYAPEFTVKLKAQSATLSAARRIALVRGGKGEWRAQRRALNYLKRLGLADLVQDIIAQADAAIPDNM